VEHAHREENAAEQDLVEKCLAANADNELKVEELTSTANEEYRDFRCRCVDGMLPKDVRLC